MNLQIDLLGQSFDPLHSLQSWQNKDNCAAEAIFIGRMRAHSTTGSPLKALELEHYPGMTERQLEQMAREHCLLHGVESCLIQHRTGWIKPGEAIVLIAIGADHRGAAQRCCQEVLESIKHDAPFWKREWHADGTGHWLSGNTPLNP